jgi:hypothetical protein
MCIEAIEEHTNILYRHIYIFLYTCMHACYIVLCVHACSSMSVFVCTHTHKYIHTYRQAVAAFLAVQTSAAGQCPPIEHLEEKNIQSKHAHAQIPKFWGKKTNIIFFFEKKKKIERNCSTGAMKRLVKKGIFPYIHTCRLTYVYTYT